MTRCPSELKLERHLLDPATSPIRAHVEGCAACQARLQQMEQEGETFRRFVAPATLDAVVAPRRSFRRYWLALAPAAAAAAFLLFARSASRDDYVGVKGGALTLTAFVPGATRAQALADGARVAADASLRFRVQAARPCRLWVLSVDASGAVSRLFDAPEVRGTFDAPGSIHLDGMPGPERFYAVCGGADLGYDRVAAAAERIARAGEGAVRRGGALEGLPGAAAQATLLVEKMR